MHPFELTRRLIEINSITENEKNLAFFLRDYLAKLNYRVTLQEATPGRFNVLALAGQPELVFSTHLDTVPPYLPFREDDEYLYGRGACDAKGILAAQVEAAERLRGKGEERLGLLFVVGEERNSAGALFANDRPPGSRFLIDGEPTENRLAVGSKGSLRAEILARGKAAHSAYPEMGESAILKLLDLLEEIRRMKFDPHPVLGQTTCNIGILEGGVKANIIPDRARAEIMFRYVEPLERIKARLEATLAGKAEIRYIFEVPILVTNVVAGFETTVVAFSSDVSFLNRWGQPYLLGPGSILDAHTDHERISKKQLIEGIDLYVRLATKLLGN
ncbi:MAG TPA: M20/M25/M40 family metallo-hydrolase [Acidobacteriota bacterium]|nr:M20/M25/M40 family metallo-hydrolase [Acidobacteriota bacterium]